MTVDPCATLKSLLSASWTSANTDGVKPHIYISHEEKNPNYPGKDAIKLYAPMGASYKKNAIGTLTRRKEQKVTVDIFTTSSAAHYYKLETEIMRILNDNIIHPDANFDILDPDGEVLKLEFFPGHYHGAVDVTLRIDNEAR